MQKTGNNKGQAVLSAALLGLLLITAAEPAFAGGGNSVMRGLQAVIDFLNSGFTRALAIIAVIGFGIGGLSGRIDWSRALQIIIAILIIFGSAAIVDMFT